MEPKMTNIRAKLRAMLFTALTLSAATFSTMNVASANGMMMGQGQMNNGGGISGNAVGVGFALGLIATAIIANHATRAESQDINTGERVVSRGPRGIHLVTKTDGKGRVTSRNFVSNKRTFASSTDRRTGITTTSVRNADGSHTVTRTDANGAVLN
jgi:hypothetical protein